MDIAPESRPDIVASIVGMGEIGLFDVVYCSHTLEHVFPHQVRQALGEFVRVLKSGGYAWIFVPDLEDVRPTEEVVYESPSGPVAGLDMIYGFRRMLMEHPHMAHHTGFVRDTLLQAMQDVGFRHVEVKRLASFDLMGFGLK